MQGVVRNGAINPDAALFLPVAAIDGIAGDVCRTGEATIDPVEILHRFIESL